MSLVRILNNIFLKCEECIDYTKIDLETLTLYKIIKCEKCGVGYLIEISVTKVTHPDHILLDKEVVKK